MYSESSDEARAIVDELLELSRGYEALEVPTGLGVPTLGAVGLVARGRHLAKIAERLADDNEPMASAVITRAVVECVLMLAWLHLDSELAGDVWMLDEIRTRLSHHDEVMQLGRRQRARARQHGELVRALAPGESLGLLARANVRDLRRTQERLLAEIQTLPRLAARKRRLKLSSFKRVPSWKDVAHASGQEMLYTIAYRFDSNSATHATALAVEQFIESRGELIVVHAEPQGPRPDAYVVLAVMLVLLLEYAGRFADQSALDPELRVLRERMERLRPPALP